MTSNGTIRMYGADWCGDCRRSKRFLAEHKIAFEFINVDEDAEGTAFVLEVNNGKRIIPTIVFPDGGILVEPSDAELSEKLGIY